MSLTVTSGLSLSLAAVGSTDSVFFGAGKSFDSFFVNQILLSFLKNAGEVIKILYVRTVFDGDLQVFKLFLYL